jgi:predicted enzyme related to lactoylglutathione lyase
MQNPFVWHDLMTTDVEGAKAFYKKAVGWDFAPQNDGYHVALVGGCGVGGVMELPDHLRGMAPFWSGYVFTPNVDEARERAVQLGGKVLREPWDIPGVIRMAVIADPTGAVFNIVQPLPGEPRKSPAEGAPGTVGWNELHAGNLNAAWEFIQKCSAGRKAACTTWAFPRASLSSFRLAARMSAA